MICVHHADLLSLNMSVSLSAFDGRPPPLSGERYLQQAYHFVPT